MAYKLATIERDSWTLESGVARNAEHPDSFWIPPADQRANLGPGSVVKLIFRIQTGNEPDEVEQHIERMWVYVSGRVADFYIGRLQNQPECTDEFRPGHEVVFTPEHVIDIAGPPPPEWEPA